MGYVSGYAYSVFTSLAVLFFAPLLGLIPMASLAGLMLTVALRTFEFKESWDLIKGKLILSLGCCLFNSFTLIYIPLEAKQHHTPQAICNMFAMIIVTYLSYAVDMGLGVGVGVAITRIPWFFELLSKKAASIKALFRKTLPIAPTAAHSNT